jgi:hypothetical protein
MSLDINMLRLYAKNNFNVLLSGRHGIGKTEVIKKVFQEEFNDNWAYFSAATMDAWVDFIGVPKAVTREDGVTVLELIRPARFADDTVEALFFDEYNRSPVKVRNAVMELIQFKSINGRKFKNLKVIWAAVNPFTEEGTYDVEEIDPAQLDRFPIKIDMPYKLERSYFKQKHGAFAAPFIQWWTGHSQEMKYQISPRLLDQSIDIYKVGGDLKHVFPIESNVNELIKAIKSVSIDDEWKQVSSMTVKEKSNFFSNLSNVQKFESYILNDFEKYNKFISEDYIVNQVNLKQQSWLNALLINESNISKNLIAEIESLKNICFKETIETFLGITPKTNSINFNNKNVVITGKFSKNYKYGKTRTDIAQLLNEKGATVQNSVNNSTNILIDTEQHKKTTKSEAAERINNQSRTPKILILDEDAFYSSIGV